MRDFKSIIRPNILLLEQMGHHLHHEERTGIRVHLDANENPFNAPNNRYPQYDQKEVKQTIGQMKSIWPHCIALTNGTDEAINILFRVFCNPCEDNVIAMEPTTRRYREFALLNDIAYRRHLLDKNFQFKADDILAKCDEQTKIIFLCSPNDPTGNLLDKEEIDKLCDAFNGVVVVDEGYHEFAYTTSMVRSISSHNNLIVLNTMSNAFASADLRISIIFAVPEIIRYVNIAGPVQHISTWAQREAIKILRRRYEIDKWINQLLEERRKVILAISLLPICEKTYPSVTNFFMVRFKNGDYVYQFLRNEGIAVFNCSHLEGCDNCLRITVGLPNENNALIGALRKIKNPSTER